MDRNSHTLCTLHASGKFRLQEIKLSNVIYLVKSQMEFVPFLLQTAFQHLVGELPE